MNPTCPFDVALPQPWVNSLLRDGFDPRGQVVWAYPPGSVFGVPYPLTNLACHKLLSRAAGHAESMLNTWISITPTPA